MKKRYYIFALFALGCAITLFVSNCDKGEATTTKKGAMAECPKMGDISYYEGEAIVADYSNNNCVGCHNDIEPMRAHESGMMQQIFRVAQTAGIANNDCVVCHGGNPSATTAGPAHKGTIDYFLENEGPKAFYPDPGSPWINKNTCGMCHDEQVKTQFTSLMFTEAGKIQGTTWGFGGLQGKQHNVANIATEEVSVHERLGSGIYKEYMATLKKAEPQIFPEKMSPLPEAPTAAQIAKNPSLSVYTYLRQDCQRCHIGVKGSQSDGDFRGIGCTSCHVPYSNKGLYEGKDPMIPKDEKGHMLVHSIHSTRDAKVKVHENEYSGMPTKSCTSCHNRGRRIGVSYEGLMETSYSAPFMSNGDGQAKIHKKNYMHLQPDVHLTKGMLCQDCHTSGDVHSLGDLSGAIQGAVEIECTDCHGTPKQYPWELPIGYGDEIASTAPMQGKSRGLSDTVARYLYKGHVSERRDGFLISARGNAMPHLTKKGDQVILESASGKNIILNPLKKLTQENKLTPEGKVAMVNTQSHIDKMECYACHATWAPQCYGCHINIDYSKDLERLDWVAIANAHGENGLTPDALPQEEIKKIEQYITGGEIKEQRSYLRYEDPPLVVNGDHRVSPGIPGCQTTVTVTNKDGKKVLLNHIFKVKGHGEGGGPEGQNAIDIAPVQPHTTQKGARKCESCHSNPKAMGYGIENGKLFFKPDQDFVQDILDADGKPIAKNVDTHFNRIENLHDDWSRFIDEDNNQLQTVGHHLSGSRPLNKEELMKLDRRGVCLSCHQNIPEGEAAVDLLSHMREYGGMEIDNDQHQNILSKSLKISAWVQYLIFVLACALILGLLWRFRRKSHD